MYKVLFIEANLLAAVIAWGFFFSHPDDTTKYKWVEDDPLFDCITPISYYNTKINIGVFIRDNLVATSENPLETYFKYATYLKVFVPHQVFNKTRGIAVEHTLGDIWGKSYFWVYWGSGRYKDNPVHDIMFLHVSESVKRFSNLTMRRPYYMPVARRYAIEEPSGWQTGAFALTDRTHVSHSDTLVPIYYDEPVLVDCEEYFPRFWGYFICILNIDKYPVIQSGAPLIQNGFVFGIASFTYRRGKESVYAYTDLRPYRKIIYDMKAEFYG